MRLIARSAVELRTRGVMGFLAFVRTRIWQQREDVLFELLLPARVAAGPRRRLDKVVVVSRENLGSAATAAVEREVLTPQNHAYREALRGRDLLYAAVDDAGHVTSYGFVLFDSFYKRVLGETADVPMIGNCLTFPAQRGRGLYASLLVAIGEHLAQAGYERVIITCAPDNLASVHGIQNAGFSRIGTLRSGIVLSRWIVRQTRIAGG